MMISSSMAGMAGMSPQTSNALTDTQKETLSGLLSKVDGDSLSDADAKALVEGIEEAGIAKGSGLTEALSEAGIDARALAEQAGLTGAGGAGGPGGPGGKGGPGGPGGGLGNAAVEGKGTEDASVQLMQSIVEQMSEVSDEEDYQEQLLSALEDAGLDLTESVVDLRL
ncbi:hypothetical protein [Aliishimia ponticola]|uniref:hypothetical protein n=1 Tax=Aliishimia ponticola TaxID=2499833 RepID=UPI001B3BDA77|nr:hypothetical protein [Aliishimia ponticola]